MAVVAMRAMHVAVIMRMHVIMVMVMVAVGAVHVRLLRHLYYSGSMPAGVSSPVRRRERL
jgi:hypothetical protein